MKNLCRRGKFNDTEKVIRPHPLGIGIGTDLVFGISVPESNAGSTKIPKYRISFGIPSSGSNAYNPNVLVAGVMGHSSPLAHAKKTLPPLRVPAGCPWSGLFCPLRSILG